MEKIILEIKNFLSIIISVREEKNNNFVGLHASINYKLSMYV